jgi:methylase of polypeptide subunit release factors
VIAWKNLLPPKALIEQRQQGVPFAYLSGVKGFYHLDFIVTPDTLIPRPETELLIDIALDLFKSLTLCINPIFERHNQPQSNKCTGWQDCQ